MRYRVYLLINDDHLCAADSFVAADDSEATEIASALQEVTADVFGGCQVWRGTKHVATLYLKPSDRAAKLSSSLEARLIATPVRQEKFVKLEQQLWDAFTCVRESRRLLDSLARQEKFITLKTQLQVAFTREQQSWDASARAKESTELEILYPLSTTPSAAPPAAGDSAMGTEPGGSRLRVVAV